MTTYPVIVYGVPSAPPAPPVNPWPGITNTWTGWDGSVWNLSSDSGSTGVVLRPGVRGRNMPPITHHESESEARAGSRWRSSRTNKREVFWPISVFKDTNSQEWIEYARAFWRTMHPEKPGLWTVTQPDGTTRSLVCRFVDDGQHADDWAPGVFGWAQYGITLQAEDPYWSGTPITRSWRTGVDALPFIGEYGGPPFQISAAQTIASASIPNPGDVDAFVTWTLEGPIDAGATVGAGGNLVGYTGSLAGGDVLVINTRDMSARLNGVRVSQNLSPRDFAPIPAGGEVELSITAGGTGKITATLTPKYFRAT